MKNIVCKAIRRHAVNSPEAIAVSDSKRALTYSELDNLSGRVAAYLVENQIGEEDIVIITMPKSVECIAAMIGVWKVGAAFTVSCFAENEKGRFESVKNACKSRLILDETVWNDISSYAPQHNIADVGEHAACFAVFTSGTEGYPKGVLHEVGNLKRIIDSHITEEGPIMRGNDTFGLSAKFDYISVIIIMSTMLHAGGHIVIVPENVSGDKDSLMGLYREKGVTITYMTPSFAERLEDDDLPFERLIIGSEPVTDIFLNGVTIFNSYSMSESGLALCLNKITKGKYNGIVPVGKPTTGADVRLVNEYGTTITEPGEFGEVSIASNFVRGYINAPETNKAFRNERYYTGDVGEWTADGELIVRGRKSGMYKVNGDWIVPTDLLSKLKEYVATTDWVAVKAFRIENRTVVVAYYLENGKPNEDIYAEIKKTAIPAALMPDMLYAISDIPRTRTGKISYSDLPMPENNT